MCLLSFALWNVLAVWCKNHCTFEKVCYMLRFLYPIFVVLFYIQPHLYISERKLEQKQRHPAQLGQNSSLQYMCLNKAFQSSFHIFALPLSTTCLQINYLWQTMGIHSSPIRCSPFIKFKYIRGIKTWFKILSSQNHMQFNDKLVKMCKKIFPNEVKFREICHLICCISARFWRW